MSKKITGRIASIGNLKNGSKTENDLEVYAFYWEMGQLKKQLEKFVRWFGVGADKKA